MKLNLGAGANELDGFVNRGPENDGWRFEDGLGEYEDASVDAITISHALMFLPLDRWESFFSDAARVLRPGGVLRVTEDATDDRRSERYGGFDGAVTLTSFSLVFAAMHDAGLQPARVAENVSLFDKSLCQRFHGAPPKVFHIEGVKV